jgi:hypothetical protein
VGKVIPQSSLGNVSFWQKNAAKQLLRVKHELCAGHAVVGQMVIACGASALER